MRENGSREAGSSGKDGRWSIPVIHTLTRDSDNDRQYASSDQQHPRLCPPFQPGHHRGGRMRGAETLRRRAALEPALAVLVTTIHSNSCKPPIATWCHAASAPWIMSMRPSRTMSPKPYPIVVFCRQLENKQRRAQQWRFGMQSCPTAQAFPPTLFQYVITETMEDEHKFIIEKG